jgi:transposase InsO family protein
MKKKPLKKYKHNFKQKMKDFENKNKHTKVHKNRELRKKDKANTQQQYINLESYGSFKPGEFIVCDLKHMPASLDGYEYLCTFTCLGTRLSESVFFSTRLSSEFLEAYKKFCKHIRNKTGRYPKYLQTDNGKEFIDKHTKEYNLKKGITHSFTSPHSSLQNPVAERINRTIGEGCLALLLCAHLPLCFWTYAVNSFNFVKARTPHKSLNFSNPISSWNIFNTHRASIDLYDIRIFGCEAYVLDEKSLKAHPKAFRCIYLGPSDTHKGCIFYNLYTKKIIFSRNFILNEQCVPGKTYFPNIYDRYFGSTPPFDISDLAFSTQQPTTASNLDFNNIPYSNLFHFKTNANDDKEYQ